LTVVFDMVLNRPRIDDVLLWILLLFCITFATFAFVLGERFPVAAGLVCVGAFAAATVFFVGPWGDEQSAISSSQEMPILALYLGWFVARPLGRILMLLMTGLLLLSYILNPIFAPDGLLGVPTAVQTIVISLFCFEIGSMVWRKSEREITIDPLTGALLRRAFFARISTELARFERHGSPFVLVVIDFDHFKELNDTEGHAAGDRALVRTVDAWQSAIRAGDILGRTGGDEFAMILGQTDAHEAQQIMRRLREHSPHSWSWGIAQSRAGDTPNAIFARADERLYESKWARS